MYDAYTLFIFMCVYTYININLSSNTSFEKHGQKRTNTRTTDIVISC